MTNSAEASYRALLEAISLAARVHQGQLRKDGRTPYASHVFRVCLIVRQVFGVDDISALTAAVLHDTVEDTTTDYDELKEEFGAEVAGWVSDLSKDKRLPDDQREKAYETQLAKASWSVLRTDKELVLLPVFSLLASLATMATFALPIWFTLGTLSLTSMPARRRALMGVAKPPARPSDTMRSES